MFIYTYVYVDRPFDQVEREILASLPQMQGWANVAYREGEHLYALIGTRRGRLAKSVELHIGAPRSSDTETWLPIEWEATGPSSLFPRMEADLVIAAVGPTQTQIALRGRYTVPLGTVGRALDRALFHRIAESSVKSFVDRIGSSISIAPNGSPAEGVS